MNIDSRSDNAVSSTSYPSSTPAASSASSASSGRPAGASESGTTLNGAATAPRKPLLRAAATLLVLRDGAAGLEVLMVRRPERKDDRSGGAFVFPGGVLDPQDVALHVLCDGLDDSAASKRLNVPERGLDYYLCAVRELFEEAGLLLGRDGQGQIRKLDDLDPVELASLREAVAYGGPGLAHVCAAQGLRLAVDRLAYFAHWLTPPGLPKRFDTRFFVALAPEGQTAMHDGKEAVEHRWLRPVDALDPAHGLTLVNVTRRILTTLARFDSAQACFEHASKLRDIAMVMPRLADGPAGIRPVQPEEAPYAEIGKIDPDGAGHGRYALQPGLAVRLSERIVRVTADNGNVMTGPGTNTYLVGGLAGWAVIDPGPDDETHLRAVMAAAPGPIRWILATHTHLDHSPGAATLKAWTGAPVYGRLAGSPQRQDPTFAPDRVLEHGEQLTLDGQMTLRVVHTPGHASNHLCFLLEDEKTLFTGDHVMQGSTVVIGPPDGDMRAYLASLSILLDEDLEWLAPGHGFLMPRPRDAIRLLMRHRQHREAKVLSGLREIGPASLETLVTRVYDDAPVKLHGVAQRSLLAHLLKLAAEGAAREAGGDWEAV